MRITIVIGAFLPMPPAPTGAIEKVWHRLGEVFAARGHQVTVLCPTHGKVPEEETIRGVRYLRFGRWRRTGSTKLDLVKDLLYSLRVWPALPEAEVTVTNCFWLPALLRLGRRARVGVLDVHAQRFPKRQFGLYRGVDRISTVSEPIAAAIREQTPAVAGLLKVIGNPVDIAVFRPDGPRGTSDGSTVLFTGRIHPEKGLHLLVEACAKLHREIPGLRLQLVGPSEVERGGGGAPYVERLQALAGDLALEFGANIAEPERLAEALRSCSVYCYPSVAFYGEASPIAPLEAMACGAVTVVSDLPQFGGYVTDGVTGLVFPRESAETVDRLADCLRLALTDRIRAAAIAAAGVAKAREFSVERVAEAHLEDFAALIAARRRTA